MGHLGTNSCLVCVLEMNFVTGSQTKDMRKNNLKNAFILFHVTAFIKYNLDML